MSAHLLEGFLNKAVKRGRLGIVYADGSAQVFGAEAQGFPDIVLRFTDALVPRDIVLDPRLGAAEAYMDGRLILEEGDILGLISLLRMNDRWENGSDNLRGRFAARLSNRAAWMIGAVNDAISARKNVAHHYDIGNDFYALMLDEEHWQYSCAYWPREDMTLGEAQHAKLAHIAAKLAIEPGMRVLDIGCGWGGMAIYLAQHYDVDVHAVTLSEEQCALAKARADQAGISERITFELVDYRDLAARSDTSGERFDRIVSVGMFEHVGQPQFETFFESCTRLLSPTGVMLLHTIGRMGEPGTTDAFTRKYIFPGGYIPALSEIIKASEKFRLISADIETLRLHYARTLRRWYANCAQQREAIEAMYDARFYRMWMFYLAGAATVFEQGGMCNYQIQYARDRHALPLTRDYIAAEEARLLDK